MPTEVERLLVRMEVQMAKFEQQLGKAAGTANKRANQIEKRFTKMNTNIVRSFGALVGIYSGGQIARFGAGLIESATRIENSLKVVGIEGENLTNTLDQLYTVADRGRAPIEAIVQLYTRMEQVSASLGLNSQELLEVTDSVALAIRAQGSSAQEARGALIQLSQALGEGVVRAQEFNSINEQLPVLLREAAATMGLTRSELRNMVLDGELASDVLARAIRDAGGSLEELANKAQTTGSQGLTQLRNAATRAAEELNRGGQMSDAFADSLANLAAAIDQVDFTRLGEGLGWVVGLLGEAANRTGQLRSALIALDQVATKRLNELAGVTEGAAPGLFPGPVRGQAFRGPIDRGPGNLRIPSTPFFGGPAPVTTPNPVTPSTAAPYLQYGTTRMMGLRIQAEKTAEALSSGGGGGGGGGGGRKSVDTAAKDAERALADLQKQQESAADSMASFSSNVLSGIVQDLRNGASAGEAFANALSKIGDQLLDSALQQLFRPGGGGGLLAGLFGGGLGVSSQAASVLGSGAVGLFHGGGTAGSAMGRRGGISPAAFAGAPRYHNGGTAGLAPDEVPAILQRGEKITPRGQMSGGNAASVVQVTLDQGLLGQILSQAQNQTLQIINSGNTSRVAIGYNDAKARNMIR